MIQLTEVEYLSLMRDAKRYRDMLAIATEPDAALNEALFDALSAVNLPTSDPPTPEQFEAHWEAAIKACELVRVAHANNKT